MTARVRVDTHGRVSAQDVDAEAVVLSRILHDASIACVADTGLEPAHMYADVHRAIYAEMLSLDAEHVPIEAATLALRLHDRRPSIAEDLMRLGSCQPYVVHVVPHIDAIRTAHARRELMRVGRTLAATAATSDVAASIADARAALDAVAPSFAASTLRGWDVSAALLEPEAPVAWIAEVLALVAGPPVLLAGRAGAGKSLVAQALAVAIAAGVPALGGWPVERGPVVHLDAEQGRAVTHRRYRRMAHKLGVAPAELGDLHVVEYPRLDDARQLADVTARMRDARLLIVDSWRACCPSLDEDASGSRWIADAVGAASDRSGCGVLILAHARKSGADDDPHDQDVVRGSGAHVDAAGAAWVLRDRVLGLAKPARVDGSPRRPLQLAIADTDDGGLSVTLAVTAPESATLEGAADDRRRARTWRDAAAVVSVLLERPGVTGRKLEDATRATAGCGSARARAAIAALGAAVVSRPGPRRAEAHYLDGSALPDELIAALSDDVRETALASRPDAAS